MDGLLTVFIVDPGTLAAHCRTLLADDMGAKQHSCCNVEQGG